MMPTEKKREVLILSTGQIFGGKTAGSQRMMNIARSVAAGNVNVFLASYDKINRNTPEISEISPGIFHLQSNIDTGKTRFHLLEFVRSVNRFISLRCSDTVLYLYPTAFVFKDFIYLLYFKFIKKYRIFCDINELRSTNVRSYVSAVRYIPKALYFFRYLKDYFAYKISELLVLFFDGIVVISTSLEKHFSKRAKKLIRIPVLSDLSCADLNPNATLHDKTIFRICFAGFISCRKEGFSILFNALQRINLQRRVDLYLYGILIDEEKLLLEHLASKYSLNDKVHYLGNLEPEELIREFKKYDLLILPRPMTSQAKYGFSTKLSEYMISGVPVLVTDVSDNALYIKDNYNGYIIPPGSSEMMEEKILDIIKNYNSDVKSITENALKTAEEYFDYRLYTEKLINFLFTGIKN